MKESNLERRAEKSAIRHTRQIGASECLGLNCSVEVLSSRQSFSLRNSFGDRQRRIEGGGGGGGRHSSPPLPPFSPPSAPELPLPPWSFQHQTLLLLWFFCANHGER